MSERDHAASVRACYAGWAQTYHDDYYGARADYPPVHVELVRHLLRAHGSRFVLDAGCGPASLLRELSGEGLELYGFDLTPEMVTEARRILRERGLPPGRVWEGSVVDPGSFRASETPAAGFDAALCVGVLPHVPPEADADVIANLRDAVRPGGLAVLQARNQLFALFTLNRYSHELFLNELIRADELRARAGDDRPALERALHEVASIFRMDLPRQRVGADGRPGYDEVLSRGHNPLTLERRFRDAGFADVRVLFYHFHRLPPLAAALVPELAVAESLAMEDPGDWRGYFMASAFMLAGTRSEA